MAISSNKRSDNRCTYEAPLWISQLNRVYDMTGLTQNHCLNGICLKTNGYFHPNTVVMLKMKDYIPSTTENNDCEGPPMMSLGEVRWCRETPDEMTYSYEIGVKYFPSLYG